MGLIDDFKNDIRIAEGKRAFLYDDDTGLPLTDGMTIRGNPTIGYGRALNKRPLSDNEIEFLLDNDINDTLEWCLSNLIFWADISENRKRAIANMVYQLGGRGFLNFREAIAYLKNGDYEKASKEILDSEYAKETPKRAQRIAEIILFDKI